MNFHISSASIRRPIPTIVLFLILAIGGLFSFNQLGIDSNPNIDLPVVSVTVTQPGASPSELETQVTKPVEDAVAGLGDIDRLTSTVNDSVSNTRIEFELGTDSDRATNDVRNAIAQIRQELPADIEEPVVQRVEFAGGAIMTYAVTSDKRSVEELSNLVDDKIAKDLLSVSGVAQVERTGGLDREILVELNPTRLKALNITATEVNNQIRAFNLNSPSGRATVGSSEQNIRTLGSAPSVETLRNYRISLPNGDSVTLESLASIKDSYADPTELARYATKENGANQQVVAFSVLRSSGSNLVNVESGVREAIADLRPTLPEDIQLQLIFTRADATRDSYQATIDALILGCLLTVITVGIFLKDWRPTVITGLALPLSIIPTFIVMKLLGYTLNNMTLLALSLAVGNLVDDAICMVENIDQHLLQGKTSRQAALDGSREIGLAVVATTATIVSVFMPVAFMGGVPGKFFQPFGVTVSAATLFSTLVAVTMTPMLAAYILKPKRRPSAACNGPVPQSGPYRSLLTWALKHRITTLLLAVALFIGSLQLVPYLPKGLFGSQDDGLSVVSVELPPGSRLEDTDRIARQASNILLEHPAAANVFASIGGDQQKEIDSATLYVNLLEKSERAVSQSEFERTLRRVLANIPGARISFQSRGAGGSSKDFSLVLTSENPDALVSSANKIERQMRDISGMVEVESTASLVKPEILIKPNPARAADLGVSVQSISQTVTLATIGDNEANLPKFDLPDRQIPIRVQLAPEFRNDLETLRNLQVPTNTQELVPLSTVADITIGSGPAQIDRSDRARQVTLSANLQGLSLGEALTAVKDLPAFRNLPPEVNQKPDGDAEIMREVFSRFFGALGFGVLCIYAVLVLLYNNFLHPFAILVALPLSIGGALLGLLVTQKELGLFALIGIVLLMGLATKNAILLVDATRSNQREGKPRIPSIIEAGVSRLRPIFMTAVSTISGMMPIALALGAGGEVRSPMAIAAIGGFSTSTLLTLVVVPVLFSYIDRFSGGIVNIFRKEENHKPSVDAVEPAEAVSQRGIGR
ncbi:efflux RND transporter permease subunit [Geitlerinema sp. PCC 9228]|jgi:hydrophobe/amphiphile efflux-1 (HAE1) family protein|uniref:efflux RND transporter permease subunit n=1 Tax=Geitlerinema sp. PCC 9228 TaxID=111611 RepID=UPI0008F9D7FD|nr:efflux RND transporter permease subunit [Geitlerinema sp. PCC 9228]